MVKIMGFMVLFA